PPRQEAYELTPTRAFERVIKHCADMSRPDQAGTWITRAMRRAYAELHRLGVAHSVEAWSGGKLVGGLYGVSLGAAFFGESMFHSKTDASKVALAILVEKLKGWGF